MKRIWKQYKGTRLLSILIIMLMLCPLITMKVSAATVSDNLIICKNTRLTQDIDVTGNYIIKSGKTLTIPENVTLTIRDGGTVQARGNIDIQGKIVVEHGGRFYRTEYGIFQETVGPTEDIGQWFTPLLANRVGSVEVKKNGFHFPFNSATLVARSSIRLWNEVWTMEHESEVKYGDDVSVDVTINGPDFSQDTSGYARLILGFRAKNSSMNLSAPATYYNIYNAVEKQGKWVPFNGLQVMSVSNPDTLDEDTKAWVQAFWKNARMTEPELTETEAYIYRNQIYDDTRSVRNEYNLFIPKNLNKEQPVSLILFTHGGSWTSGDKESMDYACAKMAREGYITADIDYRLFGYESNPAQSMNDILDDMQQCINTIYRQTSDMGYTVDQMATSGYSAGGHLALLYAYERPKAAEIPVSLVFEEVGPADLCPEAFAPGIMQSTMLFDTFAAKMIPGYASMNEEEKDAALNQVSPANYVNVDTVPTVMAYAQEDIIVGYEHGNRLNGLLNQNQVDHVFYTLSKSNHTCEFDSSVIDAYWETSIDYCDAYLSNQK